MCMIVKEKLIGERLDIMVMEWIAHFTHVANDETWNEILLYFKRTVYQMTDCHITQQCEDEWYE
jgi:hypothetical protein